MGRINIKTVLKSVNNAGKKCVLFMTGGVLVNVLLSFGCSRLNLPLYMDTIGTIGVAAVCGLFPAIITALMTNVFCTLFNDMAIYYAILNVMTAFITAWFMNNKKAKNIKGILVFIGILALITGGFGAVFQRILLARPQFSSVEELVSTIADVNSVMGFFIFILINIGLNIVDKGLCAGIVLFILRFISEEQREMLGGSGWKQRPLTHREIQEFRERKEKGKHSLQGKMTWMLTFAVVTLTVIMAVINVKLYFENTKKEYTQNAFSAAKFAADVVDAERVDEYILKGEDAAGYTETKDLLYRIRENSPGVEYLYLVKIEKDGCYFVFDLDTDDVSAYEPGDRIDFEEAFMPYLPALFAGKEIEPIESNDISGWVLTVYYPVRDGGGNTVCYVGADVSMVYLSDYIKEFIVKVLFIFSGFFVLILAYGLWVSRYNLIYPINSMAAGARDFINASEDQEVLDANVEKFKSLDIHTNDEVEQLYQMVCKMTEDLDEQMRDIRHYTKTVTQMQNGIIFTMADMVESRDSDTGAHIQKTAAYVRIILNGLKRKGYYVKRLTPKYMSDVEMSAPLHDIGKINIPDAVLNKPGKLTDEEFEIMKTHTTAGKEILERAISTIQGENYLREARNMAAYHHEKWNGTGYPEGLRGEVIPLSARIMAVADVFDALVSKRVYKDAMPLEKALGILQEDAGSHFDPKCVEVFMESLDEVKMVMEKYKNM